MRSETRAPRRGDRHPPRAGVFPGIPGRRGLPVVGHTLHYIADPEAWSYAQNARYGDVWWNRVFFRDSVVVQSAEAAETLLFDRDHNFSSELGWWPTMGPFFPGGLMLRDFDEHRLHRRLLQSAFRRAALDRYVAATLPEVEAAVARWPVGAPVRFYPLVKRLLLEHAARVFLGLSLGDDARRVMRAFTDLVAGPVAAVPFALPGTARWRALRARAAMAEMLRALIPARRAADGEDMFTRLCRDAEDAEGRLTDDDIIDHMIFLLMAAHDTTTSALTTLAEALAQHPDWQERARDEARAFAAPGTRCDDYDALPVTDLCLREALRIFPPVPALPRRSLRACELGGVALPANATVWIDIFFIHRAPGTYTEPARFDPERFSDARAEHRRHRCAWIPFGGGAHTCIGMQFATVQAKMVVAHLLRSLRWRTPEGRSPRRQIIPLPRPVDGLPLIFERVR
jgi:cytochrome P450